MALEYTYKMFISGPDEAREIELRPGDNTIGRQAGSFVLLQHPKVSRKHAQFGCLDGQCLVTDTDSTHGTFVNGRRLAAQEATRLSSGDVIFIEPYQLVYELLEFETQSAAASPEPEEPLVPDVREEPVDATRIQARLDAPAPPLPPEPPTAPPAPDYGQVPPGLSRDDSRLIQYLPGIYETDFMKRFLAMFESILLPIEWNVDNFDMFLDPMTAPPGFLPWLANWFSLTFDSSWNEEQRRMLLAEAHQLFAALGTKWAMSRILEIYVGRAPEIDDESEDLEPFTFTVNIPVRQSEVNHTLIEHLIDANKPAQTSYKLRYKR